MVKTRQQQRKEIEEDQTNTAKPEIRSEVLSYKNSGQDVEWEGKYSANEIELDCSSNAVDCFQESDSKMKEQ